MVAVPPAAGAAGPHPLLRVPGGAADLARGADQPAGHARARGADREAGLPAEPGQVGVRADRAGPVDLADPGLHLGLGAGPGARPRLRHPAAAPPAVRTGLPAAAHLRALPRAGRAAGPPAVLGA